jgi:hypothetical protein
MPPRPNSYSCVTNSVTSTVILPVLFDRHKDISLQLRTANRLGVLAVVRRLALSGDSWITSYFVSVIFILISCLTSRSRHPFTFLGQTFVYNYLSRIAILNFITLTMFEDIIYVELLVLQVSGAPCSLTRWICVLLTTWETKSHGQVKIGKILFFILRALSFRENTEK